MKVASIYLLAGNKFSSAIQNWATEHAAELVLSQEKPNEFFEALDSLLIFNQNQEMSPEIMEVKALFDKQQKPVHKIDINGTLRVGITNFELWLETNKVKSLLILGSEELTSNPNLERYITA
ncbi:MAG: hypothetical protein RLZZ65_1742 [Bacteroidota bacterium]|jgi:hypothetical protein